MNTLISKKDSNVSCVRLGIQSAPLKCMSAKRKIRLSARKPHNPIHMQLTYRTFASV